MVRLNGGKGNAAMTTEVCKELTELDLGEWPREMADAGEFLSKRDYTADPAQLQIVMPRSPTYSRAFWQIKASNHFPKLAFAANKLLSAHTTTAAAERNWSAWGRTYDNLRASLSLDTAEKLIYVKANMPKKWLA